MSLNARIAGNGVTQLYPVVFKDPNALSAMNLINQKTIDNLGGIIKQTKNLILLDLRLRRENLALTPSSAPTIIETIRQIQIFAHSGRISSIANGISRNTMRSMKTDQTVLL